jgi:hypothetical protein
MKKLGFVVFTALTLAFSAMRSLAGAEVQSRVVNLGGEIKDPNGDLIIGARIALKNHNGFEREVASDGRGRFQFTELSAGSYGIKVIAEGFGLYEKTLNLDSQPPLMMIVLHPTIHDEIVIEESAVSVRLDPQSAGGSQLLKLKDLEALPDDPDQFAEQLKLLATSSGSAPGQAVLTVDGFAVDGKLPPKSAIKEVRINPDLFSAEYDKAPYQGGRIQIVTRPGSPGFNGSLFLYFNNFAMNARDAFAPVRAPSTTSRYGVQIGGPLVRKKSGFFFDFETRDINEFAAVNAIVLDGNFRPSPFAANVPAPRRLLVGSARFDLQATPLHTFMARYDFNRDSLNNQGVGGFNLPGRASTVRATEHSIRLSATSIITTKLVNEARVGITRLAFSDRADSAEPAIDVLGAFTSGGSVAQSREKRDWRIEIADNLSFAKGKHTLKVGAQLFGKYIDDGRRDLFNGMFTFGGGLAPRLDANGEALSGPTGSILENISGLEQYRRTLLGLPGGVPTRFTISRGNPSVGVTQWIVTGFIQNEWRLRQNLSLSLGLRYEGQNAPADRASLAPRLGLAFSPDKKSKWVLRARAGIFYDRINETLPLEARRLDGAHIEQVIIDSPSFPDPFIGESSRRVIPTVREIENRIRPPASFQAQIGFERQMPRGWKFQMNHSWSNTWGALRSRNINAPLLNSVAEPAGALRPLGVVKNILQFESSSQISGQVLFVGVNQARNKYFNLFSGYLFFDFKADSDSPFMSPQSSYDLAGEWARPSWQSRHRGFITALLNLPWKLKIASTLNAASGTPFNITTGRDNNGDGNFSDRPSFASPGRPNSIHTEFGLFDPAAINGAVSRNTGTNPAIATADLNLSRTFQFGDSRPSEGDGGRNEGRYRLTVNVRASNLLNRTNVTGLNGVLASPFFGRANIAQAARRVEVGMRFSF